MVAGFSNTTDRIFVLYQYQDGMMQWSSTKSEVSMQICTATWTYTFTTGSIHDIIVTDSNVNLLGRYAFLYQNDEIMPAGTLKHTQPDLAHMP